MNDDLNLLITVFYTHSETLMKCAVKVEHGRNRLDYDDLIANFKEPENAAILATLLPLHVRSCGPIVDVETIFEIAETKVEG